LRVTSHYFLLLHVLKMSSFSTNANGGRLRDSLTAQSITRDPEQLTRCWCTISIPQRTIWIWL